ncbi:hypothetical protein DVR12_24560 [Chitinophaga silvatica]|uniref:Lipoprotein n=1 Tax=Chitinophaga silvatica TaxID=2282649 RepID=A0A3E1Y373_9BACT|nr:hypothetical protein [Chitinophaga silvatica]RFS19149.1 hypothetical protein DVR12_24560 [Chitinophaga silvatica]
MNKKFYNVILLFIFVGCGYGVSGPKKEKHNYTWKRDPYTGALVRQDQEPPRYNKRRKKHSAIHPSIVFVESMKGYRTTIGSFPQDLWAFENYNDKSRNAIRSMKDEGFKDLKIDYLYLDSLVLNFTFNEDAKRAIGNVELSSVDRVGQFIFVYNRQDSTLMTTTVLPKKKNFVFKN